jgi:hypothetical protein
MAKSDSKEDMKMDKKQDVALIKKAFKEHDAQEHPGMHTKLKLKKGGLDKMKKMAGGKTNEGMKMIGRGLEKAKANGKAY